MVIAPVVMLEPLKPAPLTFQPAWVAEYVLTPTELPLASWNVISPPDAEVLVFPSWEVVPGVTATCVVSDAAWLATDCSCWTSEVIEVIPLLAA